MEDDSDKTASNNCKSVDTSNCSLINEKQAQDCLPGTPTSLLRKSRYGRTHKPKISEDFYNIDDVFETSNAINKSPTKTRLSKLSADKSASPKCTLQKCTQQNIKSPMLGQQLKPDAPSRPQIVNEKSVCKPSSPNTANSQKLLKAPNARSELKVSKNPSKARKFFKRQLNTNDQRAATSQADSLLSPTKDNVDEMQCDIGINETLLALDEPTIDVTKVLKIVSNKPSKSPQISPDFRTRPILKTYGNKRKHFYKTDTVETFALPDEPIFPLEPKLSKITEPEHIHGLDVELLNSESEINIVDKKLLETPWEIPNMNDNNIQADSYWDESSSLSLCVSKRSSNSTSNTKKSLDKVENLKKTVSNKTKLENKKPPKPKFNSKTTNKMCSTFSKNSVKNRSQLENETLSNIKTYKQNYSSCSKSDNISVNKLQSSPFQKSKSDVLLNSNTTTITKKLVKTFTKVTKGKKSSRQSLRKEISFPRVSNKGSLGHIYKTLQKSVTKRTPAEKVISGSIQKETAESSPRNKTKNSLRNSSPLIHKIKDDPQQKLKNSPKIQNTTDKADAKPPQKFSVTKITVFNSTSKTFQAEPHIKEDLAVVDSETLKKSESILQEKKSPPKLKRHSKLSTIKYCKDLDQTEISVHTSLANENKSTTEDVNTILNIEKVSPEKFYGTKTNESKISEKEQNSKQFDKLHVNTCHKKSVCSGPLEKNEFKTVEEYTSKRKTSTPNRVVASKTEAEVIDSPVTRSSSKIIKTDLIELPVTPKMYKTRASKVADALLTTSTVVDLTNNETNISRKSDRTVGIDVEKVDEAAFSIKKELIEYEENTQQPTDNSKHIETRKLIDQVRVKMESCDFDMGDLMWAKIGGHPYWPCLITAEPHSGNFKENLYKKHSTTYYHVRFFGDNGRRSWVAAHSVLPFVSKDDLKMIAERVKSENKPAAAALLRACKVSSYQLPKWQIAADEAESLKTKTTQQRYDFFFDMFASKREKARKMKNTEHGNNAKSSEAAKDAKDLLDKHSIKSMKIVLHDLNRTINKKHHNETLDSANVTKKRRSDADVQIDRRLRCRSLPAQKVELLDVTTNGEMLQTKSGSSDSTYSDTSSSNSEKSKRRSSILHNNKSLHKYISKNIKNIRQSQPHLSDELVESVLKESWGALKPQQKKLAASSNDVCSEYSLSDTDSSKLSSCTLLSNTFKEQVALHKRNNLFKGVSKDRVCQVCGKPKDVLKCKGPCNGLFHSTCSNNKDALTSETKNPNTMQNNEDANSKNVEIICIDCDHVNCKYNSLPKIKLTSDSEFCSLSLSEKIDMKMKEVMENMVDKTTYADSTTDDNGSESSTSQEITSTEKNIKRKKLVGKKKGLKIMHVTADHVSFSSASTENICESTSSEAAERNVAADNKTAVNISGTKDFKCKNCSMDCDPFCFVCHKELSKTGCSIRQKCSMHQCGKFYHPKCLKLWPQTQWSLISTAKHKSSNKQLDTFVCPAHVCHTCVSDNPRMAISRCPSDKVVKCLHCPSTFHSTNYCVPAGSVILSSSQIICPRHLGQKLNRRSSLTKNTRTINTTWCFICSEGGDLICCETCPTSVHMECLNINFMDDDTFICEDCESGRFPLYDEIVWVKLGAYRWWPAVILFPNDIPDNISNIPHGAGEFVVKFFGTHDHYWVHRGRVFLFQEGDKGHATSSKKRMNTIFQQAIEEATIAHQFKKDFKLSKEAELKTGLKPPPYIKIKVNKPVGNVRQVDANISNTTACECNPKDPFPCGPDSVCLNRLLLTECNPEICPAGERCNNQRFELRQYPPLVPFRTQARGWGLKTLAPIRKGDFVIEYVGEIIDDQEYQRRIKKMHEQKDENYYFLTIDKDRIIDAGPKGNVARFMNHCCQPNCETQKWTVNGDTRVGLFASDDIPADKEVNFNYNLECIGEDKKICHCGAPNCSGFIGAKAKSDESLKKPKKININFKKQKYKKKSVLTQRRLTNSNGICCVCGENGNVEACPNSGCTKYFHPKCVQSQSLPNSEKSCSSHHCNNCKQRTIRCCVKCCNSYCPAHSEGNVRYDNLLGYVCSQHDPTRESQEIVTKVIPVKKRSKTISVTTNENDVTSTTSDDGVQCSSAAESDKETNSTELQKLRSHKKRKLTLINDKGASPKRRKPISLGVADTNLVITDKTNPESNIPLEIDSDINNDSKRKRGRPRKSLTPVATKAHIKVEEESKKHQVQLSLPIISLEKVTTQNEVKLSSSVPARHLRTTRNSTSDYLSEMERFLKQQRELDKALPIRKRSRLRCETTL